MNITDVEFHLIAIGRTDSGLPVRSLVVQIETEAGVSGWGEASCGWQPVEIAGRRDVTASLMVGRSIFDIEEYHTEEIIRQPWLRAAIEMACLDAIARSAGQPLCRLLGGEYRRQIPLIVPIDATESREITDACRNLIDRGFHDLLLTATGHAERDIQSLRAADEYATPRTSLWLDGAKQYDIDAAHRFSIELERIGPRLWIDPLKTDQLGPVAELQRETLVPLGVDRAVFRPADVLAVVRSAAGGTVGVNLARVGGVFPARRCVAVAGAGNLALLLRCGSSLGIATAAMLHTAAALPELTLGVECCYPQLRDDLLTTPLEIIDAAASVPSGPGLGIEIDRDKLDRYQVGV